MKTNNGWRKAVSFAFALALAAAPVSMNGFAAAAEDADEPAAVSEAEAPAADTAEDADEPEADDTADDTAEPEADDIAEPPAVDATTGEAEEEASGKVLLKANVYGQGQIAATDDGSSPVFDPEFPMQSYVFNVDKGTVVNLDAKADEGHVFLAWINEDTNEVYADTASISIAMEESLNLIAIFDIDAERYMVQANISGDGMGQIAYTDDGSKPQPDPEYPAQSIACNVIEGDSICFKAFPDEGSWFICWMDDATGEVLSREEMLVLEVTEERSVIAVFYVDAPRYLVSAVIEGQGQVSVAADESKPELDPERPYQSSYYNVLEGHTATIAAKAAEGWHFLRWENTKTGKTVSTEPMFELEITEPLAFVAVFEKDGEEGAPAHIAADETLKNWAKTDYEKKNGVTPAFTSISTNSEDEVYEIELSDENGAVLAVYTIDPATGKGSDAAGKAVDLPQTGLSGVHTAATGIAVLLGLVGSGLVLLSRKKDED